MSDLTKQCSRCGIVKAATDFLKRGDRDALRSACKACMKVQRDANPWLNRLNSREWRKANPEKSKESNRSNRAKNIDARRAYDRERRSGDDLRACNADRRARAYGIPSTLTGAQIGDIRLKQCGLCAHCKTALVDDQEIDHKLPMVRGGPNVKANVQLTCGTCNARKHTKTRAEFAVHISVPR